MTPEQAAWFAETFDKLVGNVEQAIVGKDHPVRLALTCLLSEGHLLLEDVPGTGKTTSPSPSPTPSKAPIRASSSRPTCCPADVTGGTVYDQRSGQFEVRRGPVFATVLLADEINRASPKTQSALLEVMEESQVTIDGNALSVGPPFMVIATQNPIEQAGTYRLPEAQLDRFLMRTALGYPDHDSTIRILSDAGHRNRSANVGALITSNAVVEMTQLAATNHVDPAVLSYVSQIADATRSASARGDAGGEHPRVHGLRARAAKTWAASQGRNYVVPDDIKLLAHPVMAHRVSLDAEAEFTGVTVSAVIDRIISQVAPPAQRAA